MKIIKSFSIFEKVYVGKIDLTSYAFIYDRNTDSGYFELEPKGGESFKIEVKSNGRPEKNTATKFTELRFFSPSDDSFDKLSKKMIYILNKNRLGYKFKVKSVEKPRYGLKPFAIVSVNPSIEMLDLDKIISSTKQTNSKVKKDGGTDQFTF